MDWTLENPRKGIKTAKVSESINRKHILYVQFSWKLRQEHDEEVKRVMDETGCTFRKWNGKAFWELANECGHTSLDFDKCDCKRHYGIGLREGLKK